MQEYWSAVANRLRDAAKWTATALGAALAAVIGTSPLAAMRVQRPHSAAIILAAAGLVLLGITMFLVLQVMRPQSVSYGDVESARSRRWLPQRSLYKLKQVIDVHQDLYLPCGISGLDSLRQSMVIEEATLMALADAIATAADATATTAFCEAKAARADASCSCASRRPGSPPSANTTNCGGAAHGPPIAACHAVCWPLRLLSRHLPGRSADNRSSPGVLVAAVVVSGSCLRAAARPA